MGHNYLGHTQVDDEERRVALEVGPGELRLIEVMWLTQDSEPLLPRTVKDVMVGSRTLLEGDHPLFMP